MFFFNNIFGKIIYTIIVFLSSHTYYSMTSIYQNVHLYKNTKVTAQMVDAIIQTAKQTSVYPLWRNRAGTYIVEQCTLAAFIPKQKLLRRKSGSNVYNTREWYPSSKYVGTRELFIFRAGEKPPSNAT